MMTVTQYKEYLNRYLDLLNSYKGKFNNDRLKESYIEHILPEVVYPEALRIIMDMSGLIDVHKVIDEMSKNIDYDNEEDKYFYLYCIGMSIISDYMDYIIYKCNAFKKSYGKSEIYDKQYEERLVSFLSQKASDDIIKDIFYKNKLVNDVVLYKHETKQSTTKIVSILKKIFNLIDSKVENILKDLPVSDKTNEVDIFSFTNNKIKRLFYYIEKIITYKELNKVSLTIDTLISVSGKLTLDDILMFFENYIILNGKRNTKRSILLHIVNLKRDVNNSIEHNVYSRITELVPGSVIFSSNIDPLQFREKIEKVIKSLFRSVISDYDDFDYILERLVKEDKIKHEGFTSILAVIVLKYIFENNIDTLKEQIPDINIKPIYINDSETDSHLILSHDEPTTTKDYISVLRESIEFMDKHNIDFSFIEVVYYNMLFYGPYKFHTIIEDNKDTCGILGINKIFKIAFAGYTSDEPPFNPAEYVIFKVLKDINFIFKLIRETYPYYDTIYDKNQEYIKYMHDKIHTCISTLRWIKPELFKSDDIDVKKFVSVICVSNVNSDILIQVGKNNSISKLQEITINAIKTFMKNVNFTTTIYRMLINGEADIGDLNDAFEDIKALDTYDLEQKIQSYCQIKNV